MPESIKWVWNSGPDGGIQIIYTSYIMEAGLMLWGIGFLTLIIALFTITNIIINAVSLLDDRNRFKITTLTTTSICLIGSVILVALMREHVTLQNIFIMAFFFIQIILHVVNLILSSKQKKLEKTKDKKINTEVQIENE